MPEPAAWISSNARSSLTLSTPAVASRRTRARSTSIPAMVAGEWGPRRLSSA